MRAGSIIYCIESAAGFLQAVFCTGGGHSGKDVAPPVLGEIHQMVLMPVSLKQGKVTISSVFALRRLLQIQGVVCGCCMASAGHSAMNYTYVVKCSDGTYYTGWTNNLEKRIRVHNEGKGAKYTRSRGPVELVYYEEFESKEEAMSREARIKRLTRKEKEQLIGRCLI